MRASPTKSLANKLCWEQKRCLVIGEPLHRQRVVICSILAKDKSTSAIDCENKFSELMLVSAIEDSPVGTQTLLHIQYQIAPMGTILVV